MIKETIERIFAEDTDICVFEAHYCGDDLHRINGPAMVDRNGETLVDVWERWFVNGLQHREDGPAEIVRDAQTGEFICREWWLNGQLVDPPKDGSVPVPLAEEVATGEVEMHHDENGALHRTDGPAWVMRDRQSGIVTAERWYRDGEVHRDDGPAVIKRNPQTGEIIFEEWWGEGEVIKSPRQLWGPAVPALNR